MARATTCQLTCALVYLINDCRDKPAEIQLIQDQLHRQSIRVMQVYIGVMQLPKIVLNTWFQA